ncbi:MAG: LPS export ABC transporter periplasmic protein LptC [Bacteroidetes bacterium]|nr:MAG: LPS export ABC transporter periplasmic protein LptC [Bacteroidota bacterium]
MKKEKKVFVYFKKLKSIAAIFLATMLFACENDIQTIYSLSQIDSLPLELVNDLEVIYSDSGYIQAKLQSPIMKKYQQEDAYYEFPEGFKVIFYDSLQNVKSQITANYGINWEKEKKMEAKNNVIVFNKIKNEKLETEHLVWDQKKKEIFSDVFIKITKPDAVIYGDGLTSDQNFSHYIILNPTGEFKVETSDDQD